MSSTGQVQPGIHGARSKRIETQRETAVFFVARTPAILLQLQLRIRKNARHMGVSIVMGVPQNGWFIRENPIKLDDLGVPPLMETPTCCLRKMRTQRIKPCQASAKG